MAIRKTIYLSDKNANKARMIRKYEEHIGIEKESYDSLGAMLADYAKTLVAGLQISGGAMLALADGDYEKITTVTLSEGSRVVVLKPEFDGCYSGDARMGDMMLIVKGKSPDDELAKFSWEKNVN